MGKLMFTGGDDGTRPSTQARKYIERSLANFIEDDLSNTSGWLLGGLDQEPDRRRAKAAAKKIMARLRKNSERSRK